MFNKKKENPRQVQIGSAGSVTFVDEVTGSLQTIVHYGQSSENPQKDQSVGTTAPKEGNNQDVSSDVDVDELQQTVQEKFNTFLQNYPSFYTFLTSKPIDYVITVIFNLIQLLISATLLQIHPFVATIITMVFVGFTYFVTLYIDAS